MTKLPYKIDTEFKAYLPVLSEEAVAGLRSSIGKIGLTESLIVWKEKGILLDGHNRGPIAVELKKPTPIKYVSLPDRDAAIEWIRKHQLDKRNLTDEQRTYYIGEQYNYEKNGHGGDRKSSDQNDHLIGNTAENIAKQQGVSEPTVRRAGEFAAAVDTLAKDVPDVKEVILAGEANATIKDITQAVLLPPRERKKAAKDIAAGKKPQVDKPRPSGKQKTDPRAWEKIDDLFGKLKRAVDDANKSNPAEKFCRAAHAHLNEFHSALKEWRRAVR